MNPGSATLSSSYVPAPTFSDIGDAIYVAAPSTPATIAGTNIIYQEPQGGRAAAVDELTSTQQVIRLPWYSFVPQNLPIDVKMGLDDLSDPLSAGQCYHPLSHVFVKYWGVAYSEAR